MLNLARTHGVARWQSVHRDPDQRSPVTLRRSRHRAAARAVPRARRHIPFAKPAVQRWRRASAAVGCAAAEGELGALQQHAQFGAGDSALGAGERTLALGWPASALAFRHVTVFQGGHAFTAMVVGTGAEIAAALRRPDRR